MTRLAQTFLAVVVSGLVFVSTYAGLGNPARAIGFLLRFQRDHAAAGHQVAFAGRVSQHPPGWAFLWFAAHGVGWIVTAACLICIGAAIARRHDQVVLWCLAALAAPLVFHTALAGVVLSFYWVMWMPFVLALVALGAAELVGFGRSIQPIQLLGLVVVALCCGLVVTAASVHDTYRMLTLNAPDREPFSTAVREHSPLTYLRLDDLAATTAADSSGNDRPGTYQGRPHTGAHRLVTSEPGTAAEFKQFEQHATIAGAPWMDVPDYSFSVWFSGTRPNEYLLGRDNFVAKVWNLQFDAAGQVRFATYASFGGAAQVVDSRNTYDEGRPHLAVGVKSGSTMVLYVDGRLAGRASFRSFARSTTASIDLAHRGNGAGHFVGALDDFAFYDVTLSASYVRTLFRAGSRPAVALPSH